MELKDAIQKRQSIRNYEKKDVKSWIIGEILNTARLAPSSGNIQNWRFIIVREESIKKQLAIASLGQYWMTTAPVHIVVCSEESKIKSLYKKRGELYSVQNCAVAAAYIMLKALEFNLGTCWVGAFNQEKISKILGLERDVIPQIIITLGYPKKYLEKPHKRHDLDKMVYFEQYKNKLKEQPKRLADYLKELTKKFR